MWFSYFIVAVHLGFDFYQRVSPKMGDVSSGLPGGSWKKGGSAMEDDKMSLPCIS